MKDAAVARRSLYQALGALGPHDPGLGNGETIVTEAVETVDGDRMIEVLLTLSLIG
ncbi:MAG: hypothetical protein ACLQPH_00590 [Acidimicrobiales bacterium]